jgi:hypothetical protein
MRKLSMIVCAALCYGATFAQDRPGELPKSVRDGLLAQGWHPSDLTELEVRDRYQGPTGVEHLYLRQHWQGIEVWNGDIAVHTRPDGRIIQVNNGAWSALERRVNSTTPAITAQQALQMVLARTAPNVPLPALLAVDNSGRRHVYQGDGLGHEPAVVTLVFQPVGDSLRLAWNVNHYLDDGSHWWNIRVDALSGTELDRNDWVRSCAWGDHGHGHADEPCPMAPAPAAPNDYRVFAIPVESPSHGSRSISNAPWLASAIASPFGWHDTNGSPGAEFTDTRGNNCRAQEDRDANNTGGYRPNGGATLDFDFPLNLALQPVDYQDAAITNLFYWNNVMHDVWYHHGFTEVAGNFQQNNYGRGGIGNDWVNADAQDGSGTNNATFATPADGSPPRMTMFEWTQTNPRRDSDLDNGVIAHEYGHGITNRMVGGPSNANCIGNAEQMGEGWSDWFGLMMTMKATDTRTQGRGIGTYLLGQPTTGVGIRPARYSTSFSVNNFTYASTNNAAQISQPHGIGFVWCTMLWEMTWDLIDLYGFDADLYTGNGGNNIAMKLVIEALKYTPCSPGFVDARNAILQADQVLYDGANQQLIWAAFARRGLGASASQGSTTSRTDQVEAFDMPLANNLGVAEVLSPSGEVLDCGGTVPVVVRIRNFGLQDQTGFPVTYQLNGGTVVQEVFQSVLAAGSSADFTFATQADLGGPGQRTVTASTSLPGDQFAADDSQSASVQVLPATPQPSTFFEGLSSTNPTPPGWRLQNPDNGITWTAGNLNVTPNPTTGCAAGTAWGINFFSYAAAGQEDYLFTPPIDLGGSAGSRLKFHHAYRAYSATFSDRMRVDVSGDCGATWTSVFDQAGSVLATGTNTTSSWTPTTCTQWRLNDIDLSDYDGQVVIVRFTAINGYGNWLYLDNVTVERNGISVALRLMLDGPYNEFTQRMDDGLRVHGLIPLTEPYTANGYVHTGGGGGESVAPALLTTPGDNAVVDWVIVELRDASAPTTVLASRAALVQRDGDVVDKDGASPVAFARLPGNYHIAVRHRNHLGCMTAQPVPIGTTPFSLDLSDPATATFGTDARRTRGARTTLWPGNAIADDAVRYTGADNDRDPLLQAIGGVVPTNEVAGYRNEDINMDGSVRYTGGNNDRDIILQSIGGVVPTNARVEQLP